MLTVLILVVFVVVALLLALIFRVPDVLA